MDDGAQELQQSGGVLGFQLRALGAAWQLLYGQYAQRSVGDQAGAGALAGGGGGVWDWAGVVDFEIDLEETEEEPKSCARAMQQMRV